MTEASLTDGAVTEYLLGALKGGHLVDLSHTIEPNMPVHPNHPQFFSMPWDSRDIASSNQLLIGEHTGTHMDSPCHIFSEGGKSIADIPLEEFIGPAVKIDLSSAAARQDDFEVGLHNIKTWENSHRSLRAGDAVIFRFGWSASWGLSEHEKKRYLETWPGIDRASAEYLVSRHVRLVGTDCLSVDGPRNSGLDTHRVLLGGGASILENLNGLDQVPDAFILMSFPLKIEGGTGSPVRAVALVPGASVGAPTR